MAALNGLVLLLLTISAMFISECYSSGESQSIQRKGQCEEVICHRKLNHLGERVTSGCPTGCLCVIREPDNVDNANGTCYALMSSTTTTTTTPDGTTTSEEEE
uniref:Complement inhibitor RaCI3 n=1 Tax=Dermacentor andersoni TaxID=34620 RepID=C5I3_DERAN|nr:RecName: Full=Complement inhibitor RaCI3; Flags: Precursor [Dermacentor andersoni]DAA64995.1 TPA_exp: complement inhibitor RaCI3 precursor [Dermacentor andersoni]